LIGRLLHDSKLIMEDQLSSLVKDSTRHETTGPDIDYTLLVDGSRPSASRESRSTSPTGSSARRSARSSQPIRRGMSSIPATWRRAPPIHSAGDPVVVAASGRSSRVKEIVTYDGPLASAAAGDAVTQTLADDVDVARGDVW
jgi:sulfate adenylyltransferase subunit 1 (EFTu-like GTPase family)